MECGAILSEFMCYSFFIFFIDLKYEPKSSSKIHIPVATFRSNCISKHTVIKKIKKQTITHFVIVTDANSKKNFIILLQSIFLQ